MRSSRHPHPHIDPRQPRNNAVPGTNPPVFAWKPGEHDSTFRLTIARDPDLRDTCIDISSLSEPVYLPETAFDPGIYYWTWAADTHGSETDVFCFEIPEHAVILEIPCVREWLNRFPDTHPRIYIIPEEVQSLRDSRTSERAELWTELEKQAGRILAEKHECEEPPFLPDWETDYKKAFDLWLSILQQSRKFMQNTKLLALAYLACGKQQYARAACERLASVSSWDPEGSSYLPHNDEAHMSVLWHGPQACDWVWDEFTPDEREQVIAHFKRRAEITYEFMHDRGSYGVTRFDSHAGREIVFLAQTALVFHEHIPDAAVWLDWLRPILCGIWPVWAGDDGGWAEGPLYGLAYVSIMTMFATALKKGTGIDLYTRPFWKGHARWRQYCFPPYAEWIGFGDHTVRTPDIWQRNADLVDIISRQTKSGECTEYIEQLREETFSANYHEEQKQHAVNCQLYLLPPLPTKDENEEDDAGNMYREFPVAGWCAVRTDLNLSEQDIALIFRSSPFGSISHSHANNNDFIIHAGGRILAMPSGYYDGYGSNHHTHWVWNTKSHNCITLSGAGQLMRSPESRGSIDCSFQDVNIIYFRGTADASYQNRAERCRRHVCFLKTHRCFLMIDEFRAKENICSSLQWNIHSWAEFDTDEHERTFRIEREGNSLSGFFMYSRNSFFSLSSGWDPEPIESKSHNRWFPQFHLTFTPTGLVSFSNLGVILCPACPSLTPPCIHREHGESCEAGHIGEDIVMVNQTCNTKMTYDTMSSDALAALRISNTIYEIRDTGISRNNGVMASGP